jgi:hypothetical protein
VILLLAMSLASFVVNISTVKHSSLSSLAVAKSFSIAFLGILPMVLMCTRSQCTSMRKPLSASWSCS